MRLKTIGAAAEDLGSKGFVNRFSIGRRLTLCFVGIFILLLAVNGILLWQFNSAQVRADRRLTGVSVELIAVLNLQSSLQSFNDRLDRVAQSQNAVILRQESGPLRVMILDSVQDARNAITHLPPEVRPYPTLIPTIEAIESTLPLQLESLNSLAASGDWSALRLRLANEKQPLDAETSMLVKSITRELNDELGQTVTNIARLQRQMVIVLPLTALGTLLIASFLGLMITRSITTPLGKLMDGSSALSRGEFDHLVPISGDDELARLGRVFNDTADKLRSLYETLRDSKAKLEEAQRITHVGYWEWDPLTDRVNWSDETYRIYGMQPQERTMYLATVAEKIHPEDWKRATEAAAAGVPFSVECRLFRPTGEVRIADFQGDVKRDSSGQPSLRFGTVQDITDRKRAEEALQLVSRDLQESNAKLEEAQRITHVGYWEWDLATDRLNWSDETYRIFGLQPQERPMNADELGKMVHPEDRDRIFREKEQSVNSGAYYDVEHRIVRPSGEVRVLNSTRALKKDESGRPSHFYGTVQDITERKHAEQRLRESEAYLAEAQRLSQTGSWAWNPATGDIRYWSEMCFSLLGFDPAGPLPRFEEFFHRIHLDDQATTRERFDKAIRDKADFELDYRVLHPEKGIRDIHVVGHAVLEVSGNLDEFVGTVIDVTERKCAEEARKRAEEELRKSEAYLAEAQRLSQTGSWAWSPDPDLPIGKSKHADIRYWSEECYRVLSFDPQDGLPRFEEFFQRIHPDDQPGLRELIQTAIREKAEWEADYRIVHPDGRIRDIHVVGHPVLSTSDHLVEFVGTVVDVTEHRRAEQERARLGRLEADLAHIDRVSTLGEMAASLAHEIKQPIAAAITSANSCIEWLAHEPPNLDRARAAAARIDKYGNRAAEIIDRIRCFYKKSPPQRELVDVNGIVNEILTLLNVEAARSSIAMRTDLSAELPKIMADRVQLQQVFMNLMLNAIEAMEGSGGELTVRSELQDGQLQFSVSDTGVGLPTEKMDQIFSAFFTTKPHGSGMGLAISRSIVESHGGRLWATANDGRGATFHFTLPIQVTESSPLVA